jgi:hypothetical protein
MMQRCKDLMFLLLERAKCLVRMYRARDQTETLGLGTSLSLIPCSITFVNIMHPHAIEREYFHVILFTDRATFRLVGRSRSYSYNKIK